MARQNWLSQSHPNLPNAHDDKTMVIWRKTVHLKWHDDVPKFLVRPPLCYCRISVEGRGVMTGDRVVMSYHYGVCRISVLLSSWYGCMYHISLVLSSGASCQPCWLAGDYPDSKVHGVNIGPTWVLSAPDGSHVGPMNLAISGCMLSCAVVRLSALTGIPFSYHHRFIVLSVLPPSYE